MKENDILTLKDYGRYLLLQEVVLNNNQYFIAVKLNEDDSYSLKNIIVLETKESNKVDIITDKDIINNVCEKFVND